MDNCITNVANEIYQELGEPSDISLPAISFYLSTNIGKLNILIDACYEILNSEISPELGNAEKEILKKLYEIDYLRRQVNKNLGAAAINSVQTVKEGDVTITKFNKNEISKTFLSSKRDAEQDLRFMIQAYRSNGADPRQSKVIDDTNDYYYGGRNHGFWRQ